jgi:hypothetical protein
MADSMQDGFSFGVALLPLAMKRRITSIRPIYNSPQGKVNPARVRHYRQMLKEGKRLPPVTLDIRLPDGRWQLYDGRHRLRATILEGRKTIEVFHLVSYEGSVARWQGGIERR